MPSSVFVNRPFSHESRPQISPDEVEELRILDALPQQAHQLFVVNMVEKSPNVTLNNPVVVPFADFR